MSDNNGCIPGAALLGLVMLIATVVIGAPIVTGDGLTWDSSGVIARQNARLEAERLRLAAETRQAVEREETARIMSDNMMTTIQWLAVVGGVVGGLAVAGWATARSVEAWAARPHRPVAALPPAQIIVMAQPYLAAMRDARLEYDAEAQAWVVYSDVTETVKYLTDGGGHG
jgi:hypothetical protein